MIKRKEAVLSLLQFIKFGIVGVSNVAVALAVYYLLKACGMNYILANTIGYIISIVNAFLWNSTFVFKSSLDKKKIKFIKTFIAYGVTYFINTLSLWIFVDIVKISETIAPLMVLVVVIPINFIMNKCWVYKGIGTDSQR